MKRSNNNLGIAIAISILIFISCGCCSCRCHSCLALSLPTPTSTSSCHYHHQRRQATAHVGRNLDNKNNTLLLFSIRGGHNNVFIGTSLLQTVVRGILSITKLILKEIQSLTIHQQCLFVTTFLFGFVIGRIRHPFWKRYTQVQDIPLHMFQSKSTTRTPTTLWGSAVSISDGDTIRFLHRPTPFHSKHLRNGEKLSQVALPIRICTIDAPEIGKFGKPGQPFSQEAKAYLSQLLHDKTVGIRILKKDQYNRIVAQVFTRRKILPFLHTYMDEQLLQEGLAEIYTGNGAVYGPRGIQIYETLQAQAKKSKKGIWSLKNRQSAAEYKRRHNNK